MTTIGQNQNSACKKRAAPSPWKLRQRLGTATLVTSNLLILAASNVLFPSQASPDCRRCSQSRDRDASPVRLRQASSLFSSLRASLSLQCSHHPDQSKAFNAYLSRRTDPQTFPTRCLTISTTHNPLFPPTETHFFNGLLRDTSIVPSVLAYVCSNGSK